MSLDRVFSRTTVNSDNRNTAGDVILIAPLRVTDSPQRTINNEQSLNSRISQLQNQERENPVNEEDVYDGTPLDNSYHFSQTVDDVSSMIKNNNYILRSIFSSNHYKNRNSQSNNNSSNSLNSSQAEGTARNRRSKQFT